MKSRRLTAALAALVTIGAVALAPQTATADPIVLPDLIPIDSETVTCTQLVPHAIAPTNAPVRLDLRILRDGVSKAEAATAVVAMRKAFSPLGISVSPTYKKVTFSGRDADGLTRQAKKLYHGKRPAGVDIVYTMTSKDITSGGSAAVAGLADCIGGIRFAHRAFAVGENFGAESGLRDGTGKTLAHEVGHLLGAHHHYTSPEGLLAADPNLLDMMAPFLNFTSLRFSTVNSLMVRAHAQKYAR